MEEAQVRAIPLAAVLVFAPIFALGQGGRSDQEAFQGSWKWTSGDAVAVFGTPSPILRFEDTRAVIANTEGDAEKDGHFEVFPAANPPELVLNLLDPVNNRKWERKAAYEVAEKSLKLCFHAQPMLTPTCRTAAVVLEFRRQ